MMKKRIFLSLLILLLCFGGVPADSIALESGGYSTQELPDGLWEESADGAYAYILGELLRGSDQIDLSEYGLTVQEMSDIYAKLYYSEAELFIISSSYTYRTSQDGKVSALLPKYAYEADQIPDVLADFKARAEAILETLPEGLSPLEQVMYVYDYLATHFVYEENDANFDAYGMLVEGNGVCQAYSLLMRYLLRNLGIPCECVTSRQLNHEWNIVYLDGAWYHMDVTWDDVDDHGELGQVYHRYFLQSDSAFMAGKHCATDWISPVTAQSTRYDTLFLEVTSAFVFADGEIYAVRESYISRFDDGERFTDLKKIDAVRHAGGGSVWVGIFSGLAYAAGMLIYNTESELRGYDPSTGKDVRILAYRTSIGNYMYGFRLSEDGIAHCAFKFGANDQTYSLSSEQIAYTVTWSILGKEYSELYLYGQTPTCKEQTALPDDQYRFVFLGWDREITAVTQDVTYIARYEMAELYPESAQELIDCVADAAREGATLLERYTALSRAEAIRELVNPGYAGLDAAISELDVLISEYAEDTARFDLIFSGWLPID